MSLLAVGSVSFYLHDIYCIYCLNSTVCELLKYRHCIHKISL